MRNKQKILLWLSKRQNIYVFKVIFKFYEPLAYLFFGALTTVVNFTIFIILENTLGQENWYISNIPSIFFAILFAYLTNRSFVFDSNGNFWVEMYKFFTARILVSLAFEYLASALMYNILNFDAKLNVFAFSVSWFKIISVTLVLVANYLASKLLIFKNITHENGEI